MKYRTHGDLVVEAIQVPSPPDDVRDEEYIKAQTKAALFTAKLTNAMPFAPSVHTFRSGLMRIGVDLTAEPTDWLVRYGKDGYLTVMTDTMFKTLFTVAEDAC